MHEFNSRDYVSVHGPRAGDRVRLGDTNLVVEVEADSQRPGDEFLAGFGKTARDGLHLKAAAVADTCDLVISNVLIIDPVLGIRKASIGIREGRIHAIGRAGNPDTLSGVDVIVGTGTAIVSGEGLIATAGAIDTHVHLLSPRIMEASLASGVTTIIGQEFGPVWGVGVNSPWALRHAFNAFDAWPVNIGFLARGSSSHPAPLIEALAEGGACGFKVHEDMGAHARALDTALNVAEDYDVQVAVHTDGLNEALAVEDTLAVLDGRTIHAFHIEGCGGGHVPNVLRLAGEPQVIGSSTNPTLPFGRDALGEHFGMIVSAHGLKVDLPGDAALARDRIRAGTMGAEDVLHDLGIIPITSSDAQGMGRAGETVRRTFAVADKMKRELGPLADAGDAGVGVGGGLEVGDGPGYPQISRHADGGGLTGEMVEEGSPRAGGGMSSGAVNRDAEAAGGLGSVSVPPGGSASARQRNLVGPLTQPVTPMASVMSPTASSERSLSDPGHDNERVLRYLAKLTVNPAIAHGLVHEIGTLEPGKLADIVLWQPALFGAKPQLVLKAGFPAYGVVGDPNAATDRCEPLIYGPQFGGHGATAADLSLAFVAGAAMQLGADRMPTRRRRVAVRGTRGIGPAAMVRNRRVGAVRVDPGTGLVTLDGEPVRSDPADSVPLSRLYFL